MPTMIIHGDEDPVFPLEHAHALKKAIPQAKLTIIPGLGHGVANKSLCQIIATLIIETTQMG